MPRALSPAACQRIIRDAESRGFSGTAALYPASYRDNDRLVLDDPRLAASLFDRLHPAVPERIERAGETWRLAGFNSRFRFCRYRGGQSFCIHRDGAHAPDSATRSLLTCQIYLNEGFSGGHTRFYADRNGASTTASIGPAAGSAVIFDHDLWHDGESVTEGTKYVMRTDVMYERQGARAGHLGYVFALCSRRDGSLASGSRDRTIRLWRAGVEVARKEHHDASVTALAEDSEGMLWSASRDGTVRREGSIVRRHDGAVLALAALPGGVASAGADGTIAAFSKSFRAHDGWVWALAAAGDLLASGGQDGTFTLWNARGLLARTPGRAAIRSLCVTPQGFACGRADGTVSLFDTAGTLLNEAALHRAPVASLALIGEQLATGGEDDDVHLADGYLRVRATYRHPGFVSALAAHHGHLATGCYDGLIRFY